MHGARRVHRVHGGAPPGCGCEQCLFTNLTSWRSVRLLTPRWGRFVHDPGEKKRRQGGFPKVDEYDVLDSGEEELIAGFAQRIQYLYEELLRLGYLV